VHVRAALVEAGDEQRVAAGVGEILRRGTGADLQRRVHGETSELTAVVRAAVALTTEQAEGSARASAGPTG